MAVTKIHPIKTTLKKALKYICNPEKTDEKLLVSSFGCQAETADIEFAMTQNLAAYRSQNVLARHLIQAFEPGEVTPEKAHELGKQLADQVLGGKYEYVLTTHIDKGHVHNHIIFNNVDMVEHKRYNSNKNSYHQLRRASDQICKENGLSVIQNPVAKNIGRKEYEERKQGTSWKGNLQQAIDICIKDAKNFEHFLQLMQDKEYEIKQGKHIAFRAKGQERFTRAKTIGEDYTEERIKARLQEQKRTHKRNILLPSNILKINLLIDLNAHRVACNRGYQQWAKVYNLQQSANTLNFIRSEQITTYRELGERLQDLKEQYQQTGAELKQVESKSQELAQIINDLSKHQKLLPVVAAYQKAFNKKKFYAEHTAELIIFEAAKKTLERQGIPPNANIDTLKQHYADVQSAKQDLYRQYTKIRAKISTYEKVKNNADSLLRKPQRENQQEVKRGRG